MTPLFLIIEQNSKDKKIFLTLLLDSVSHLLAECWLVPQRRKEDRQPELPTPVHMARSNLMSSEDSEDASNNGNATAGPTPLEEALGLTRKGTCVRHPSCPVLANHTVMSCRVCFSEEKSVGIRQRRNFAAVVHQLQGMNRKAASQNGNAAAATSEEEEEGGGGEVEEDDAGAHTVIALQQPKALESILKRLEQVQNWMVRQKEKEVMSLQLTIQRLEERLTSQDTTIQEQKDTIRALRKTIQQDLKIIKTMATQKERELELEAASHHSRDFEQPTIIITSSNMSLLDDNQSNDDRDDDDSDSMLYESPTRKKPSTSSSPGKANGHSPAKSTASASSLRSPQSYQAVHNARSPPRRSHPLPALDHHNPQPPTRRGGKKSAFQRQGGGPNDPTTGGNTNRGVHRHSSNMSVDASVTIPEEADDIDEDDDDDEDDDNEHLFVPPQQREYWSDEDLSFAKDPTKIFASFRGGLLDIPRSPPPACHNKKQKLKLRVDMRNEAPPNMRRVQRSYSGISDDGIIPLKSLAGNLSMLPSLDHSTAGTPVNSVPNTPVSLADSTTPSPKAGKKGPAPPAPPLSLLGTDDEAEEDTESDDKERTANVPLHVNLVVKAVPLTESLDANHKESTGSSGGGVPKLPSLEEDRTNVPVKPTTYSVVKEKSHDKYGDPGLYTGSISVADGLPHGKGAMNYESGRVYDGEWLHGHWNGKAKLLNPNGDTYEGEFIFDSRHGQGTYKWDNGDIYVGSFSQDKRHGHGRFSFHNGNVYEGEFCDGMFEGYGRYDFTGGYYVGEWKHGRYEGNGELVYASGAKYTGEFRNSVAHGFGLEVTTDGQKRRGCWENGQPVEYYERNYIKDLSVEQAKD